MPHSGAFDEKATALGRFGALNPHPERVVDELFLSDPFFDVRDLVQVKYEMVRRAQKDGVPAAQAARAFGFSRPVFYQAKTALAQGGLAALLPRRPGPRSGRKLTDPVLAFIESLLAGDPGLPASALAELVWERLGLRVHPRSIQRALARRRKGGRSTR